MCASGLLTVFARLFCRLAVFDAAGILGPTSSLGSSIAAASLNNMKRSGSWHFKETRLEGAWADIMDDGEDRQLRVRTLFAFANSDRSLAFLSFESPASTSIRFFQSTVVAIVVPTSRLRATVALR